ncbi:hypothetical protein AYI68_g7015 [Smittium mucronatum]|uniref:Uncharacterized protein n=1 Tax=Smittium mucronatum TaxID=133383 RepID=A0A1R0GPX3_9FUNG|nr:hypothetical protein AYI68_g7015 [Smittium mucronatum]
MDKRAGITPLVHLSTLQPLLPVLTTLVLVQPPRDDTRYSITGPHAKLTDGSKPSLKSRVSIEIDTETSLSLSSATSRQASTSGAKPYG